MHAGAPIAWGCTRHKDTAQSSCQAEVHSINETTKLILEYKLLFRDLNLPLTTPVPILNDNQGAIQWSKGTTTKKMRWINLRENIVRENVADKNITVLSTISLEKLICPIFSQRNFRTTLNS